MESSRLKGGLTVRLNKQLKEKNKESLSSVLPITAIVFLLSISIAPLDPGTLVLFLFRRHFAHRRHGLLYSGCGYVHDPHG